MTQITAAERVRAFGYVIIAAIYFLLAQSIAAHAASGLSSGEWFPLFDRGSLLFLLVVGYWAMGRIFNQQKTPVRTMGLDTRPGWRREFGLGAALGWGMLLVSILPLALSGGLIVSFWSTPHQYGMLFLDLAVLAVASLAEEVAFRGYPFQRLIDAMGPFMATLAGSVIFAAAHLLNPGASHASFFITIFSSWLLSVAYLRTRALWLAWGWHFAWNASMAVLFGLPVSGLTQFSPVIQSNTIGPLWMTGGNYGPEASGVTAIVLLVGIVVVYRATRPLAYQYAQPVIIAAGIPVDVDALNAGSRQQANATHAEMFPPAAPAGSTLVQIAPAVPPPPRPDPAPEAESGLLEPPK